MKKINFVQFYNKNKLTIAGLLLALSVSSPNVYADGYFSPLPEALPKSIYLDSSQVLHPFINLDKAPSPSEYRKNKMSSSSVFSPEDNTQEGFSENNPANNGDIPTNYVMTKQEETNEYKHSDAFTPPDFQEENKSLSEIDKFFNTQNTNYNSPVGFDTQLNKNNKDSSYAATVEEMSKLYTEEVSVEGKTISGIKFTGLNLIKEDEITSYITTKNGSLFNSERIQKDLQNLYSTGYFTDIMQVEPVLNDDDTVELEFILQENVAVNNIDIKGNTIFSDDELMYYLKPLKNKPQNLNLINVAIEKINTHYHEQGYILEGVTSVDDDKDGNLTLEITEGIIDKIVFEGNNKTQDFVIKRNILTQPGTVYNEDIFKKDLTRVHATQIFEAVDREIEPSHEKEGEYIVTVKVKEASSNSVSIGAGIDSALGLFGSVGVTEKNFLGRAQQLSLSGMIGSGILLSDASMKERMNYQVELCFREPHFINADNSLLAKMYYRDLGSYQVPLAIERRFGLNSVITHKVKKYDNLTTNLGLGYEHIHLKEGDFGKIASLYAQRNINIALREKQLTGGSFFNIAPGVKYSTLDSEFMPREGTVAKANFIESLAVDNIKNTTGRLAGSITHYFPVFQKSTLSIGAKGGIKVHGDDMPEVMAFGLGGPYTVRGFRMNGIGTGDSFIMGSAELQTPIPFMDRFKYDVLKNMRFAFFVDAGKVFDPTISATLYDRPLSAISLGVGLRVNIPGMGPISVDYGLPITHVGAYNSKGGYFTFGTAGMYDSY